MLCLNRYGNYFPWKSGEFSVDSKAAGFRSGSFHFPLGSQGRYLRGPLDLITIYERDSTDLQTSGDPRVIRKANGCCRRRLFSRSIHNYRYFFLRTRITESRFSIDKKKKGEERKKKKINLHISIKVDCPDNYWYLV